MNQQPNYELLREAYAIIGGIPDEKFDLSEIIMERGSALSCGTIACAAGWLAMHPMFQALGLSAVGYGIRLNDRAEFYDHALATVFGIEIDDAEQLFCVRGESEFDDDLPEDFTDKQVWLARVHRYLEERGQLTSQLEAAKA